MLYRGLLHCGHCTRLLVGERHVNRYGTTYIYYRCGRRRPGYPVCHAKAPREEEVTDEILHILPEVTVSPAFLEWALKAIDWWAGKNPETPVGMVKLAEKALAKAERELTTLTDLVLGGHIEVKEYKIRRRVQENKITNLRRALAEPAAHLEAWKAAKGEVTHLGALLVQGFKEGNDENKRSIVSTNRPPWQFLDVELKG